MFSFFRKKSLKKLFSLYTSDIDKLLGEGSDYLALKKKEIYFILIKIKDVVQNNRTPALSDVIDLCIENGASVEQIMGPVVLISFGTISAPSSLEMKDKLIKALSTNNIAIVHGKQYAYVGNAGNNKRLSYGIVLNNISSILIELGKLNYGETKEINDA